MPLKDRTSSCWLSFAQSGNRIFGYLQSAPVENGVKASLTRLFFISYQIVGIFNDFSKFRSAFCALHFENSSNVPKMGKNEGKPCSTWLKLGKNFL